MKSKLLVGAVIALPAAAVIVGNLKFDPTLLAISGILLLIVGESVIYHSIMKKEG
jgi:hypothetical protein